MTPVFVQTGFFFSSMLKNHAAAAITGTRRNALKHSFWSNHLKQLK
jgi:hypothetical protein